MTRKFIVILGGLWLLNFYITEICQAQSLDLAVKGYGISFGNSRNFNGLCFNLRDSQVEEINLSMRISDSATLTRRRILPC